MGLDRLLGGWVLSHLSHLGQCLYKLILDRAQLLQLGHVKLAEVIDVHLIPPRRAGSTQAVCRPHHPISGMSGRLETPSRSRSTPAGRRPSPGLLVLFTLRSLPAAAAYLNTPAALLLLAFGQGHSEHAVLEAGLHLVRINRVRQA